MGKDSSSFLEKRGAPCHQLEGVVKLRWLRNLPQSRVKRRDWEKRRGEGRQEEGLAQEGTEAAMWVHRRGARGGHSPLCSAAAVDSERMALPTNTPWRQLKASYTRGTPRTRVSRVTGSFLLRTLTPSLLVILTPGLARLGSLLAHFQTPRLPIILHSPRQL